MTEPYASHDASEIEPYHCGLVLRVLHVTFSRHHFLHVCGFVTQGMLLCWGSTTWLSHITPFNMCVCVCDTGHQAAPFSCISFLYECTCVFVAQGVELPPALTSPSYWMRVCTYVCVCNSGHWAALCTKPCDQHGEWRFAAAWNLAALPRLCQLGTCLVHLSFHVHIKCHSWGGVVLRHLWVAVPLHTTTLQGKRITSVWAFSAMIAHIV
jgi:hypothetical protein